MRRAILSIILFALVSTASFAQLEIPNGDFESWETTPLFSLDPEYWQTNNGQLLLSTHQDSLPYEGLWGMRVLPIPNGIGEEGLASIEIPTTYIPGSLDFHVKYDRTATCGVGVQVTFFNEENYVFSEDWYPDDLSSDWTFISIPIDQVLPVVTSVTIQVWVSIGDFAAGEGWIAVDAMSFGSANGVDDIRVEQIDLYPNPVTDQLILTSIELGSQYELYDLTGSSY